MTFGMLATCAVAAIAALSVIMAGAFLVQRRTGNSGWVDTIWTFGLGAVGMAAALMPLPAAPGANTRQMILASLIAAWALRLGLHIAFRSAVIKDDPRYARLSEEWGAEAPRKMFVFLQQQALGTLPLVLSIVLAAQNPGPLLRWQDWAGFAVLATGIVGEALADRQLRLFKLNPGNKHRIIGTGLWGWSRHPNYFFQWFGWLAYPLIAIDLTGDYPFGWLALAGPAVMYWVLRYATGVPYLEQHMLRTRGDIFRAYQARTNLFFPGPPKPAREP